MTRQIQARISLLIAIVLIAGAAFVLFGKPAIAPTNTSNVPANVNSVVNQNGNANTNQVIPVLVPPVQGFFEGITLKKFGTYITPANSPVQPERFTGYHAGVDAEFTDQPNVDIPVLSVAPGTVELARWVSGYGGVMVIRHEISNLTFLALYGHLRLSSLPAIGDTVGRGQQIAVLGQAGSNDTDGERKHLHFAVLKGQAVDLRGYVQTQGELSAWYDPVQFFQDYTQ